MFAPLKGVRSGNRDQPGPTIKGPAVTDKSPRQTMTKKSGKSLKEKRAAKHAKVAARASLTEALFHDKKR
jgi:hypothetical protein